MAEGSGARINTPEMLAELGRRVRRVRSQDAAESPLRRAVSTVGTRYRYHQHQALSTVDADILGARSGELERSGRPRVVSLFSKSWAVACCWNLILSCLRNDPKNSPLLHRHSSSARTSEVIVDGAVSLQKEVLVTGISSCEATTSRRWVDDSWRQLGLALGHQVSQFNVR
jgi:hypothetical protein